MSLKHLPQSERLLSGLLSVLLNAVDTSATISNPPDATRLPTYLEFEPGGGNAELVRVTAVAGSIVTIERGVNNGGVGLPHAQNAAYKEKFTSAHWQEVVDALESGFLTEDATYDFAKVDADTFTITGADETAFFTAGRIVRLSGSVICAVVSSSYGANVTTVNITGGTVPTTVSSVEIAIQPINAADQFVTLSGVQTMANKTLTSPKVGTAIADTNGNEIVETPATTNAVNHIKITNAITGGVPVIESVGDDTNIDLNVKAKGAGRMTTGASLQDWVPLTDGASVDIDWKLGNRFLLKSMAGNRAFTLTNVRSGQIILWYVRQDGTGGRTITFPFTTEDFAPAAVNATNDTVDIATDVPTGTRIKFTNAGGALPTGLSAGTTYYAINISATQIKVSSSLANAQAGTQIDITGQGTGTHTIQYHIKWNGGVEPIPSTGKFNLDKFALTALSTKIISGDILGQGEI